MGRRKDELEYEEIPTVEIGQALFKGRVFRRKPDPNIDVTEPKKAKFIGGYTNRGGVVFYPIREVGQTYPSDLAEVPLEEADSLHFYSDVEGPQLKTARKAKGGSSEREYNTDDEFRNRGGNPKRKFPKDMGYGLSRSAREVAQERELKRLRGQR
jgi:hypothetical protein